MLLHQTSWTSWNVTQLAPHVLVQLISDLWDQDQDMLLQQTSWTSWNPPQLAPHVLA